MDGGILIVESWHLCGLAMSGDMGRIPLTWQEIKACSDLNQLELDPFEAKIIMKLSKVYCSSLIEFKENIPPPYVEDLVAYENQMKQSAIKDMLAAKAARNSRK